jgi:signal transduction histidine kinase
MASTLEHDLLVRRITETAREVTGAEAASLLLYDPTSKCLYFEAATNQLESGLGKAAVPTDHSIAGWIFSHRKPLLVPNALEDPRFYREVDAITRFQTRSILGVPLMAADECIGVIEAVNKLDGQFDQTDLHLLEMLAAHAGRALENQRLFEQSDLVAEMVHELRTPLTALTAAANLLQRKDLPDDQRESLARTIFSEVQRLNAMATDFLDFARLSSGRTRFRREPVHLGGLVEECLQLVRPQAETQGLKLHVDLDPTVTPVPGDRNRLKQVILNLLSNAMKYNRQGGSITIRLWPAGDQVALAFSDSGRGIPAESLPHIFDHFYRVPSEEGETTGSGLGLAIVKRIVESHGGKVTVESQPGEGSTFTVWLPSKPPARWETA